MHQLAAADDAAGSSLLCVVTCMLVPSGWAHTEAQLWEAKLVWVPWQELAGLSLQS